MTDPIAEVEEAFDVMGRKCRDMLIAHELTHSQIKVLARWMYGCLHQRRTIRDRVNKRGSGELSKALRFIEKTAADLIRIHDEIQGESLD
jgi:hypothetical protein